MERVFTDKIVTAKKHYRCDASEQWRRNGVWSLTQVSPQSVQ